MSRPTKSREKGSTLVETAIVVPLLILLALGLSEVGFLVVDYLTVTNAARSGARTGASAADDPSADSSILDVVEEDVCNLRYGELVSVSIYEADPVDGSMPDPETSNLVNTYVPLGPLQCDSTGHAMVCAPSPLSCNWDPATDRDNVPPGFDALGVRIEFTHDSVTNIFTFPFSQLSESAVMQLEPNTKVSS